MRRFCRKYLCIRGEVQPYECRDYPGHRKVVPGTDDEGIRDIRVADHHSQESGQPYEVSENLYREGTC